MSKFITTPSNDNPREVISEWGDYYWVMDCPPCSVHKSNATVVPCYLVTWYDIDTHEVTYAKRVIDLDASITCGYDEYVKITRE